MLALRKCLPWELAQFVFWKITRRKVYFYWRNLFQVFINNKVSSGTEKVAKCTQMIFVFSSSPSAADIKFHKRFEKFAPSRFLGLLSEFYGTEASVVENFYLFSTFLLYLRNSIKSSIKNNIERFAESLTIVQSETSFCIEAECENRGEASQKFPIEKREKIAENLNIE